MESPLPLTKRYSRLLGAFGFALVAAVLISFLAWVDGAYATIEGDETFRGLAAPGSDLSFMSVSLTFGVLVALTLSVIGLRRPTPATPPPTPGISLDELREMRQAVSSFATLLRDGSAVLIKTNAGTLETANLLAARSQELIACVADAEDRLGDATARGELLATRVAKSAAAEIKIAVQELSHLASRLQMNLAPRDETMPSKVADAESSPLLPQETRQKGTDP